MCVCVPEHIFDKAETQSVEAMANYLMGDNGIFTPIDAKIVQDVYIHHYHINQSPEISTNILGGTPKFKLLGERILYYYLYRQTNK